MFNTELQVANDLVKRYRPDWSVKWSPQLERFQIIDSDGSYVKTIQTWENEFKFLDEFDLTKLWFYDVMQSGFHSDEKTLSQRIRDMKQQSKEMEDVAFLKRCEEWSDKIVWAKKKLAEMMNL